MPQEDAQEDLEFMEMWIENMRERYRVHMPDGFGSNSDAVRVGRDNHDDVWLRVDINRYILSMHEDGEPDGLREIKESVIMTHYMASANYELWYERVVGEGHFRLPSWFLPSNTKLPMRYFFDIDHEFDAAFYDWEDSLQFLLGHESAASEDFRRDFPRLQALMAKRGVVLDDVEPIQLMIRSASNRDTSAHLLPLTKSIQRVEKVERRVAVEHGWSFKIAALELELNSGLYSTQDFAAMTGILQLGIPVENLRLQPLAQMKRVDSSVKPETFVEFVRTVNGLVPNSSGQFAQVRRLDLTLNYRDVASFGMFCSALVYNRCLRELILGFDIGADDACDFLKERRHIWSWLSFALFSSASTNAVETLILDWTVLKKSDVDAVKAVVTSADPLAFLCRQWCGQREIGEDTRLKVEANIDMITSVSNGLSQTLRFEDSPTYESELVYMDSTSQASSVWAAVGICFPPLCGVFIPGLGFCEARVPSLLADDEERPTKRRRIEEPTAIPPARTTLRTLRFKASRPTDGTHDALISLLQLLGPRLRGVGIDMETCDEETVYRVFAACPRLESFAASEVHLESMDVFNRAYDQYNLPLSSLNLPCVSVHLPEFDQFLERLSQTSKMTKTLQRLSLGSMWSYDDPLWSTTARLLKSAVETNRILSHLTVHASSEQCEQLETELREHHGRLVTGTPNTESDRRLAFLGGSLVIWR